MMTMFDKQIQLRMGQANVRRWVDDILPLLTDDDDPLGVDDLRDPPPAARPGARGVRDVPEEARTARSRSSSGRELRGIVLPGVFAPRSDSWLLAAVARREPLPADARVLELCAGPGLAGAAAARGRAL